MRNSEVVIISDVHLGTYGCHAKELISYLKTIKPRLLILNGDIIDGWAFSKRYFPASHMEVINEFFRLLKEGTKIVYITGNHDEFLRRYSDTQMGEIWLTDKLLFELDGKKTLGFFMEMCSIIRRKVMQNLWLNSAEKGMTSLSC